MLLHWPLPASHTHITTRHGEMLQNAKREWYKHIGIDISCEIGTPVLAAHDGRLRYEWTEAGGTVAMLVDGDCYTRYAHLSRYVKSENSFVKAGEEMAKSGNTGSSTTGAHLHFEVHLPSGAAIDPLSVMEVPMPGKIAIHFQNMAPWAAEVIKSYWTLQTGGWVKAINPPVPDRFPQTRILGRAFWHEQNNDWEHLCVRNGAAGADDYFNFHKPYYQERKGIVTAWEAVNEYPLTTVDNAKQWAAFTNRWMDLCNNNGIPTCPGSIGVGQFPLPYFHDPDEGQISRIVLPVLARGKFWSYHGYSDGRFNPNDNWWALRYRLIVQMAEELGIRLPGLLISECGCDHGGGREDGWRARMNWEQHFADIQAANAEYMKDAYVLQAFLFTAAPNQDWLKFEYDEAQCRQIGSYRLGIEMVPTTAEIEQLIGNAAQKYVIPLNPNAAFEKAASAKGLLPASVEFELPIAGTLYRAQVYRNPSDRDLQYIVYCKYGEWSNLHWFTGQN